MEIITVGGKGLLPWLIKKLTRSDKSHVALRYSPPEDNWMIHSAIGGVQPEWWEFFKKKYTSISRFRCNFECADKAADKLVTKIGDDDYDYLGLFGYAWYLFQTKILRINRMGNPWGSRDRHWCTDVIVDFFEICNELDPTLGLKKFENEMTTPEEIEQYLLSCPHFTLIRE